MARPKREGWKPVTVTLSEEAARRLRMHAAAKKKEMGTLMDEIIRMTLREFTIEAMTSKPDSEAH